MSNVTPKYPRYSENRTFERKLFALIISKLANLLKNNLNLL